MQISSAVCGAVRHTGVARVAWRVLCVNGCNVLPLDYYEIVQCAKKNLVSWNVICVNIALGTGN